MKRMIGAGLLLASLAGCGQLMSMNAGTCDGVDTKSALENVVRKSVQDAVRGVLARDSSENSYTTSQIRAVVAKLTVDLADVRTSRDDPNSTKKMCSASVTIKIPSADIENVDSIRMMRGESTTSEWARDFDVERTSDGFKGDLEYSVQPTDDGSKVFAELPLEQGLFKFVTVIAALQVSSQEIREAAAEQSRQEAEERALQAAAEREAEMASQEAEAAALNEAKVANQLARQTINTLWQSFPREAWGQVVPLQRAWVQRKDAECKLQGATASIDPEQKAIAQLNCDTRMTYERIGWLRQNAPTDYLEE